jgi:tRNA dimethylallyltransferase
MKSLPKIIVIVGPTASGKSDLAVKLAQQINGPARNASRSDAGGEVVSADSRQVYKGLDIGTGKITKREMKGVKHYLLDVVSLKETYSVERFIKDADRAISEIIARKKVPIVVGGTGFYIDALVEGITLPEVAPNKTLREKLGKQSAEKLFTMLSKLDYARAQTIDKHNKVRLIRAIEIAKALGKVPKSKPKKRYDATYIGIKVDKETLAKRIHTRLHKRIKAGMIKEAENLHKKGLSYKRMRELGLEYRFLADFLEKKTSRKEMLEKLEIAINQYAKRQMTWFKRNQNIIWI